MKRNSLIILVGALLLIVFGLLLFTFQVRQTEIALVTTFDKPSRLITEPGFRLMWPPPIQRVYKFDKRVQTLDQDKIAETLTKDSFNLVVQVFVGWTVSNPDLFFSSFPSGKITAAQPALEDLVGGVKYEVVGQHPFVHFVSADPKELKFAEIEKEMLDKVKPVALKNYGITVKFLGIKKLGLPESVTQRVFDRMMAERKRAQQELEAQGERQATEIRSDANLKRDNILAQAGAEALTIKGKADAEAAKSYLAFNEEPDLANFFNKLKTLEEIGKERMSFIVDPRTPPFDLLTTNFWQHASTRPQPLLTTNSFVPMIEGKTTASKDNP